MNRVYARKGAFFSDTKVIILFDFSKRKCSFFHRKKYGMPYPTFARPQGCHDFSSCNCCREVVGRTTSPYWPYREEVSREKTAS